MILRTAYLLALFLAGCGQQAEQPPEPAVSGDPRVAQPPSRYTRLSGCVLTRSAPEEAGFFEHECPGEGGYRLRHVEADLRENIVVLAPDGSEHSLELPALGNGAFSSTGDTVEWRGQSAEDNFTPRALIVRQSVMEDPDPQVPERSYLVVARLEPEPCVVARIGPGPGQNDKAREAADSADSCLTG